MGYLPLEKMQNWISVLRALDPKCVLSLFSSYPFCRLCRWQKIFKSRLVELVVTYGNTFFVVLIVILVLLLIGE